MLVGWTLKHLSASDAEIGACLAKRRLGGPWCAAILCSPARPPSLPTVAMTICIVPGVVILFLTIVSHLGASIPCCILSWIPAKDTMAPLPR